jgi:23S rRNA pseudouridine2604 synthase
MTEPTNPPPKPPGEPVPSPTPTTAGTPAAPRRIPRAEAPRPEADDPRRVGQRVMEQRPHERKPTEHATTRGNRPDLRDLPPPRRDTPSNVWRADPPPASNAPPRDRRDGPRRAHGDAPRPDRPGERRTSPGPWQERGPHFDFSDSRPAELREERGQGDERRRSGQAMPSEPRRDGPPREPRRDALPRDPRRDTGRPDERGPAAYRERPPQGDRTPYGERGQAPAYPQGPNDRPRHAGSRQDKRGPDDRRWPAPDDRPAPRRRDDLERANAAPAQPRPQVDPNAPRREDQRLSKVIAERGIASRREADDWIDAGWVKVDGELAVLGARVFPHQVIEIDEIAKTQQAHRVTILLHKPIGYVSGQAEDGYEPASVLVTQANHWPDDPARERWHAGHGRMLAPAGRLDIDSTGLLVLTQDGRIARHLIGEDSNVEKEYLVRVEYPSGDQFPDNDLQRLRHGLWLDGRELRPAKVSWANEDQLRFVLREGRKRQIRRMCEAVGLVVTGLKRVRIGSVVLGKLPAGQWRYLREDERF